MVMTFLLMALLCVASETSATPAGASLDLDRAALFGGAVFDGTSPTNEAPAPVFVGTDRARSGPHLAKSRVHTTRVHEHHWMGVPESDPRNIVSNAAAIRQAGMAGHLLNALPPVALYGAVRSWGEALSGEKGQAAQRGTIVATIIVPLGAMMIATLALFSVIDNAWNAVEDGLAGRYGLVDNAGTPTHTPKRI